MVTSVGSLWSPKEIAQPLWEKRQRNEELSGQISSLEAEEASLRDKNSEVEREIRRLRLQLQVLPQTFEDQVAQLQKNVLRSGPARLDTEKKLARVCKTVKSLSEDRDLYKKMAEELGKERREPTATIKSRSVSMRNGSSTGDGSCVY